MSLSFFLNDDNRQLRMVGIKNVYKLPGRQASDTRLFEISIKFFVFFSCMNKLIKNIYKLMNRAICSSMTVI